MALSKPIKFIDLNVYVLEDIIKYIKFDDLVRFERTNGFWRDAIRSMLERRKTLDEHACPGMATCDKGGHRNPARDWFRRYLPYMKEKMAKQAIIVKCPNLTYIRIGWDGFQMADAIHRKG